MVPASLTRPCFRESRRHYSRNPFSFWKQPKNSTWMANIRTLFCSVARRYFRHRNHVCYSWALTDRNSKLNRNVVEIPSPIVTPDNGCLGVVVRTGFGTAQGQLVRTMIFSTERVSANNVESFLFIGFLLIFAIAASWYVWTKGKLLEPKVIYLI